MTFALKMQTIEELSICALFSIWLVLNDENSNIHYTAHINQFIFLSLVIDRSHARLSSFECYITYYSIPIHHEIFNNIVIFYENKIIINLRFGCEFIFF